MNNTPFDRIASDCMAKKFDFPEQLAKQYVRMLQKINELWGSPATIRYLDELIMPSRIDRQGFPPDVAQELVSLKQLHEYIYPTRNLNVWDPYHYVNRERFKSLREPPAGAETSGEWRDSSDRQARRQASSIGLQVMVRKQWQPAFPEFPDRQPVPVEGPK